MPEYMGFDALSAAVERIEEAFNWFDEHGFDDVETEDLVRAHWWMRSSEWNTLLAEISDLLLDRLADVEGNELPQPDGMLIKRRHKRVSKGWDKKGMMAAAVRKFRVVTEDGEPFLDDEILKVLEPATGRPKQWRVRVLDVDYNTWDPKKDGDPLEDYIGEQSWVPYLDEVNPDES